MAAPEERLRGEELSILLSQKGNTCVSIILPLAKYGPEREQNNRIIDKAIHKAEQLWHQYYPDRSQQPWLSKILQLKEKLDPVHPPQSIGLFASEQIQLACYFPFVTKEKIVIGNSFEIRDLVKKVQDDQPYLLLTLTYQKAQLYQGEYMQLTPLKPTGLSGIFKEYIEYNRPSRSTSYAGQAHVKSFEKEKQEGIAERAKHHFKQVDEIVRHYQTAKTPVVIVADREPLALYKKISTLDEPLLLFEEKDPAHLSEHQLVTCGWPRVKKWLDHQLERLIAQYNEAIGTGHTREGLQACWRAAQEGNCLYLLVDESFQAPGFLGSDEYYLFRKPPLQEHRAITDAVDDLIELVIEKKGRVLLAEPDTLPMGKKVLLITRY
jgi:hypothetical protein